MLSLKRNDQGDTLVEVLIAIAIVSLVLTAAYVITSKNTAAIQANQERIQAQHLVEAQIESLRAHNSLTTSGDCFSAAGAETPSTACGSFTPAGTGATYTAVVVKPGSALPTGTPCDTVSPSAYTICAYWTSLGAKTNNDSNVTMYYELQ